MKGEAKNSITDSQMDDVEVIYTIGESLISVSSILIVYAERGQYKLLFKLLSNRYQDFPGGPAVKTLRFHLRGCGFHPWSGN